MKQSHLFKMRLDEELRVFERRLTRLWNGFSFPFFLNPDDERWLFLVVYVVDTWFIAVYQYFDDDGVWEYAFGPTSDPDQVCEFLDQQDRQDSDTADTGVDKDAPSPNVPQESEL